MIMKQWILRAIILTMLLMSLGIPAWAMENYSEVLRDQYGRAIGGATVAVYNAGTAVLATIYSDNGSTAKANPFQTNILDGSFNFYAANGVYDLIFNYPGATFDASLTRRMSLFDTNDFAGGGGGSSSCYRLITTTPYTVVPADSGCVLEFNAAFEIDVTIPQAGLAGFGSSFRFTPLNRGSANVIFTPTISTIQGSSTFELQPSQSTNIVSDGSNYVYTPGITQPTGWPLSSTNKEITWADAFATAALFGNGTNKLALYNDVTLGPQIAAVCSGVLNNCNYYRQLNAGFKAGFKNSTGTIKWEFDEATGNIDIANMDATTANVAITVFDERHFPVCTCQNTNAYANFDLPTTNAPTPTCNTGTNTQKAYLAFNDTTDQSFQDHFIIPTNLTQLVSADIHFRWKATATTGTVGWCAQLIRVPVGSTSDPAYSAQSASNCVSDTTNGTTLQENSAVISGVPCAACAPGDHVYVRISRDADGSAVTDSMTGDALLLMYGRALKVVQ